MYSVDFVFIDPLQFVEFSASMSTGMVNRFMDFRQHMEQRRCRRATDTQRMAWNAHWMQNDMSSISGRQNAREQ